MPNGPTAAEEEGDSDATEATALRDLAAASDEVHMLAELTAAMLEGETTPLRSRNSAGRLHGHSRGRSKTRKSEHAVMSPRLSSRAISELQARLTPARSSRGSGSVALGPETAQLSDGRRTHRNTPSRATGDTRHQAADRKRGVHISPSATHVTSSPDSGVLPGSMASLRLHVEELSSQLKLAKAKQDKDASAIKQVQEDNAKLKQLLESANEVSDVAAASLRELARVRRSCEELQAELDGQRRRTQESERQYDDLKELLREAQTQVQELEQRSLRAEAGVLQSGERAQGAEQRLTAAQLALEAANDRLQSAERRAARAEQAANQEQARAQDAIARASRAEAASEEDHVRALDAEKRAARAELLLQQAQAHVLEAERRAARAERRTQEEQERADEAARRVAAAEEAMAQAREATLDAERRAERSRCESEEARALALAGERRAVLAERAQEDAQELAEAAVCKTGRIEQELKDAQAQASAAERRSLRAEQAADQTRQLALDAERRAVREGQAASEAHEQAKAAEQRAARAEQGQQEAEAHRLEWEQRAMQAEQHCEDLAARADKFERRVASLQEAIAELQTSIAEAAERAARAEEVTAEEHERVTDAERLAARAQQTAKEAQSAQLEAEQRAVHAQQQVEAAQAKELKAKQLASKAEQTAEEARTAAIAAERRAADAERNAAEAHAQASEAERRAEWAERQAAQERGRAHEEEDYATQMQRAASNDQARAREAEDRAAAAAARAQIAETRLAAVEERVAVREAQLSHALSQGDDLEARAASVEGRCERVVQENKELRTQLQLALVQLAEVPESAWDPRLRQAALKYGTLTRSPGATGHPEPAGGVRGGYSGNQIHANAAHACNQPASQPAFDEGETVGHGSPGRLLQLGCNSDDQHGSKEGADAAVAAFGLSLTHRAADEPHSPSRKSAFAAPKAAVLGSSPGSTGQHLRDESLAGPPAEATAAALGFVTAQHSPSAHHASHTSTRMRPVMSPAHDEEQDGQIVLSGELKRVRLELRDARSRLDELAAKHRAACSRIQQLEEQTQGTELLRNQVNRLSAEVRDAERLATELRSCRTQLAEAESLQLELRKAQSAATELADVRAALEQARSQLVDIERVRSEARRTSAMLQQVTRELDVAKGELAEASSRLVDQAGLRSQLQTAETARSEAEQAWTQARTVAAKAAAELDKLKAYLSSSEEELSEALRRCAKLQQAADEAAHQRDRLQAMLDGAEGALQVAEDERAAQAAARDSLSRKAQELADAQHEIRMLRSEVQEAVAAQTRASAAEQQAQARAEVLQEQITALQAQLARAASVQAEMETLQRKLQLSHDQMQTMKGELNAAADRLHEYARVQADLAANVQRAERAEAQVRNTSDELARLTEQIKQLQQEASKARGDAARCGEEAAAAGALATSKGGRVADLEHEVAVLREKSYQLEVEVASMTTELERLKADLSRASDMIEDATHARSQLADELAEANRQLVRHAAAAAAAQEQGKADAQQLQVRLAASEAECLALQHANATLHDDLRRVQSEAMSLRGELQDEGRAREEEEVRRRRLQGDLEAASEGLTASQRAQRSAAAGAAELDEQVERLTAARATVEAELQAADARAQRLQDELRALTERNSELSGQVHSLSSTVRQLEAEMERLMDGHAVMRVEAEASAAEARAARGEAAELAADRARLAAEVQAVRAELERLSAERADAVYRSALDTPVMTSAGGPRITITSGGIPALTESADSLSGFAVSPFGPIGASSKGPGMIVVHSSDANDTVHGQITPGSPLLSPMAPEGALPQDLQALLAIPVNTGALLSGSGDLSQYDALLAALDEEAAALDEELAGKEAHSAELLARMRATKAAVTARMDALQAALQAAREAESDARRTAADKDITILKLQQQLAQLAGAAAAQGGDGEGGAGAPRDAVPVEFGTDVLQGNVVISALRADIEAAHQQLRDAGIQLREAQQRAEEAEAEVARLRAALAESKAELHSLHGELAANDRVLAEAEGALTALVADKERLEAALTGAQDSERTAADAAEGLRAQVAALHAQLEVALDAAVSQAAPDTDTGSGGMAGAAHDRMNHFFQSLGDGNGAHSHTHLSSGGGADPAVTSPLAAAASPSAAGAGPFSVREATAAATTAPSPSKRYAPGPRTSDTGSTVSSFRRGPRFDIVDDVGAAAWDGSSSSLAATPVSPEARRAGGSFSRGGAAGSASGGGATGPSSGTSNSSLDVRNQGSARAALPTLSRVAEEDGDAGLAGAPTERATSMAAPTSSRSELLRSVSSSSVAGMVLKAKALAQSASAAGPPPLSVPLGSSGEVGSPLYSASPSVAQRGGAPGQRMASIMRQSLERLIGEVGASSPGGQAVPRAGSHASVLRASLPIAAAQDAASDPGASHLKGSGADASGRLVQRSMSHVTSLTSSGGNAANGTGPVGANNLRTSDVSTPTRNAGMRADSERSLAPRSAAVVAASSALQGAAYRLGPGAPSLTPVRTGDPTDTGAADAGVRDILTRRTGSGGSATGGTSSPLMSPRGTLESRTFSKVVRPVAEALASPLRATVAMSRSSSLGGGAWEASLSQATVAPLEAPVPAAAPTMGPPAATVSFKSLPILQALVQSSPQHQQQQAAATQPSAAAIGALQGREGPPTSGSMIVAPNSSDTGMSLAQMTRTRGINGGSGTGTPNAAGFHGSTPGAARGPGPSRLSTTQFGLNGETQQPAVAGSTAATGSYQSPSSHRGSYSFIASERSSSLGAGASANAASGGAQGTSGTSSLAQRLAAMDEALRVIGAV